MIRRLGFEAAVSIGIALLVYLADRAIQGLRRSGPRAAVAERAVEEGWVL